MAQVDPVDSDRFDPQTARPVVDAEPIDTDRFRILLDSGFVAEPTSQDVQRFGRKTAEQSVLVYPNAKAGKTLSKPLIVPVPLHPDPFAISLEPHKTVVSPHGTPFLFLAHESCGSITDLPESVGIYTSGIDYGVAQPTTASMTVRLMGVRARSVQ